MSHWLYNGFNSFLLINFIIVAIYMTDTEKHVSSLCDIKV